MTTEIHDEEGRPQLEPVEGLTLHQASEMFPEMPPEQFKSLLQDVQKNGILKPITVDTQGRVLDGRHRLRAARELGYTEILTVEVDWPESQILAYVLSENLHRRHLDETQRAVLAARYQAIAPNGALSEQQAATLMNVGKRSVQRARFIEREGCEELKQAICLGTVTLGAAAELAKLPSDEQVAVIAEGQNAVRAKAAHLRGVKLGPKKDSELSESELHEKYSGAMERLQRGYLQLTPNLRRIFISRVAKELPNLQWERAADEKARLAREAEERGDTPPAEKLRLAKVR